MSNIVDLHEPVPLEDALMHVIDSVLLNEDGSIDMEYLPYVLGVLDHISFKLKVETVEWTYE